MMRKEVNCSLQVKTLLGHILNKIMHYLITASSCSLCRLSSGLMDPDHCSRDRSGSQQSGTGEGLRTP